MPSSTSSSDRRLTHLRWGVLLGGALAILAAFVGVMELRLAIRGFNPSVIDSPRLWARERQRADALGSRALILVGSSRVLLDTDLDTLRRETGLEPVQLGIDGSSFVPVLQGLADDPAIKGTVLVDLAQNVLANPVLLDRAYEYQWSYQHDSHDMPDFAQSEAWLTDLLHGHLRSYADGTRPWTALRLRILQKGPTPQYLRMLPDREILADYSQVPQPAFYYYRVMRNMGRTVPLEGRTYGDIERDLAAIIAALPMANQELFLQTLPGLADMTRAIQARGGRVIYVTYPTSGYVRMTDDKFFPRAQFWDRFTAAVDAPHLNFEDVPALRSLYCPDGSHLDMHMRARFTHALVAALHLEAQSPPH